MRYGIPEEAWGRLMGNFATIPEIERVILYGARALGREKPGSDIDLSMVGANLSHSQLMRCWSKSMR